MDFSAKILKVFRHCPKCGHETFVPRSEKLFGCDQCGFSYYFNCCGAVAGIIRDREGRILLTRRAREPAAGTLDLPGGFIDFRETAEDALRRELREELNLEVADLTYFCSMPNEYHLGEMIYNTIDLFFLCRMVDPASIDMSDELTGYRFYRIEEIQLEEVGLDSIRRVLAIIKERAHELGLK